jgi:hypothetical protein
MFMTEPISVQGPVLKINGQLMLLVPVDRGNKAWVAYARGAWEAAGDCLKIVIPDWLAGILRIEEGDLVCVSNWDGKLPEPITTSPVH